MADLSSTWSSPRGTPETKFQFWAQSADSKGLSATRCLTSKFTRKTDIARAISVFQVEIITGKCLLFIAIEYDKTPTRFFSAWGPEIKEQIKSAKH